MVGQSSISGKEPWLAVLLSTAFPGIGQFYAGQRVRGVVFCAIALSIILTTGWLLLSPTGSIRLVIQLVIGSIIFNIFSLFDAHRCARRANNAEFESRRKGDKDPWLAVFLSNLIPGLGHAYQGDWGFAILFFLLIVGARVVLGAIPLLSIVAAGLLMACFYHVYVTSPVEKEKSQQLIVRICAFLLAVNILSVATALSIRTFVAEARYIPSGAMTPTLQVNDRLVIDKLAYRFEAPERGDIVIFNAPQAALDLSGSTTQDVYIKRIVGLPGETIEVRNGQVFINGEALEESYIKEVAIYEWGPQVAPSDAYFVLGDNRNSSLDSHVWGFLPREVVLGRASKIFWPSERQGVIE